LSKLKNFFVRSSQEMSSFTKNILFSMYFTWIVRIRNIDCILIKLEAPVKGWTQGGESDTPGVRTPTVLSCTSTVLRLYSPVLPCIPLYVYCTILRILHCTPLYSGSTGISPFPPWLDFNFIENMYLIYTRKKFLKKKKKKKTCTI
jgi:hypothetical protein